MDEKKPTTIADGFVSAAQFLQMQAERDRQWNEHFRPFAIIETESYADRYRGFGGNTTPRKAPRRKG